MKRDWPLIALPLMMVLVLGISVIVSASARTIVWTRVFGGPTEAEVWHGRLELRRENAGVTKPAAGEPLILRWASSAGVTERQVTTGPEGWAEFALPRPGGIDGPLPTLTIERPGEDTPIAQATPQVQLGRFVEAARSRSGVLNGHQEGPVEIQLQVRPPVLSVPFEAELGLLVSAEAEGDAHPGLLEAEGLDFEQRRLTLEPGKWLWLPVQPLRHVATVRASLDGDSEPSHHFVPLPVVPGALTLQREGDEWVVRSPIRRDAAWYALVGPWGRGPGGRLDLQPGPDGTAFATVPAQALAGFEDRYLLLSSEPDGRAAGTVGYPLDGQSRTFDAWDAFVLDSAPLARRAEAQRLAKVRAVLGAYAAICGLLTLGLFIRRLRLADRELSVQLARAGAEPGTQDRGSLRPLLAVLSLVFAFSLAVLWIVAR